MKFLVVLISVTANYFWAHDLDRFDDSWFFKMRSWLEERVGKLQHGKNEAWLYSLLLVFLVPLVALGAVLLLIDDFAFGLVSLFVHATVLLFAIDRTHPGMLAQEYLVHWREGDFEACYLFLQRELAGREIAASDDPRQLHQNFGRLYTYRCFEKMFVMIFWYMVAGPLGVMFTYICYQYRDASDTSPYPAAGMQLIHTLLLIIEWIPLRLVGLTFCLVGDFEACFEKLKNLMFDNTQAADDAIYALAGNALGISAGASDAVRFTADSRAQDSFRDLAALEIDSMQALLERSQIIWVCFLAVAAVFGLGA